MTTNLPDLIKTLYGHDLGFLKITTQLWGMELDMQDSRQGLPRLVESLLVRGMVANEISTLPEAASAALRDLQQNDGKISLAVFTRRYGEVREMGAARRDREKPFLDENATPAEALYYRALIGKAFFETPSGAEEFAYIPGDLFELLPALNAIQPKALGKLASHTETGYLMPARDWIVDDACTLLAALRTGIAIDTVLHFLRTSASQHLIPYPLLPDLLKRLLATAGLIDVEGMPLPEPTRLFLEAPRGEALATLARTWQESVEFNELHLLPGLVAEGSWQNDPLRTRQEILKFVSMAVEGGFVQFESFLADIKETYPDFQRPAGDYDSWHLRDMTSGEYLRGFKHWNDVDGELIRFIIAGPMTWLGMVELAAYDAPPPGEVTSFRAFCLSSWAGDLLSGKVPPGIKDEDEKIAVKSNGEILVSVAASRAARYQTARFCDWERFSRDVFHFQITPNSLSRAQQQGLRTSHLMALLQRYAKTIPPTLMKAVERWEDHGSQAHLEQLVVLRTENAEMLQALRNSPAARFLGDPLGPTSIAIKPGAVEKVRAALAELGFLVDISLS